MFAVAAAATASTRSPLLALPAHSRSKPCAPPLPHTPLPNGAPQQDADEAGQPHPKYSSDTEMAYTVMDFLFASQVGVCRSFPTFSTPTVTRAGL